MFRAGFSLFSSFLMRKGKERYRKTTSVKTGLNEHSVRSKGSHGLCRGFVRICRVKAMR